MIQNKYFNIFFTSAIASSILMNAFIPMQGDSYKLIASLLISTLITFVVYLKDGIKKWKSINTK